MGFNQDYGFDYSYSDVLGSQMPKATFALRPSKLPDDVMEGIGNVEEATDIEEMGILIGEPAVLKGYKFLHPEVVAAVNAVKSSMMGSNLMDASFSLLKSTDQKWDTLKQTEIGRQRIISNLNLIKSNIDEGSKLAFEVAANNIGAALIGIATAGIAPAYASVSQSVKNALPKLPGGQGVEDLWKKIKPYAIGLFALGVGAMFLPAILPKKKKGR